MTRHVRLRELLVGIEGLALLRNLYDGTDDDAQQRLAEVRRMLDEDAFAAGEATSEGDVLVAYGSWAETYDEPGNPIIALEQPVVWSLLAALPPGRALDAACGTGRHARELVRLGHDVVGIDITPEMLGRARETRLKPSSGRAICGTSRRATGSSTSSCAGSLWRISPS